MSVNHLAELRAALQDLDRLEARLDPLDLDPGVYRRVTWLRGAIEVELREAEQRELQERER